MPNIRMPDGQVVSFPDDFSRERIQGLIAQRYPRETAEAIIASGKRTPPSEEASEPPSPRAPASQVMAGLSSAVEGVPIAGPYLRSGVESAAAGALSTMTGEPYADVRQRMGDMADRSQEEYPVTSTIGKVGGAIGGTLPMVLAAPGAFGAGTGGLLVRSGASALSGAAIGGADAAVRSGGDLEAVKDGTLWGGAFGLAGPSIGALVGKGVRAAGEWLGPGVSKAQRAFGQALGRDAVDDVAARMGAMGPDAMPMDLGPNLQRQAGALAATPGRSQEIVRSAIGARDAAANSRINQTVDATIGPAPSLPRIEAQIAENMAAVGEEYGKVFAKARRVDTSPIANELDSAAVNLRGPAQKAAREVRKMLNIIGTDELDPNPYTLFQTRQAIDGLMATETNPKALNLLATTRKQVDNRLSASVPGIKKVDARFQELAQQREGLQRGQQVLDSGRTAPRPPELAREFSEGAVPSGDMVGPSAVPLRLREGTRAEIDRIIGTNANDRVALQKFIKGEGDWNRDRLVTVFGKGKADKLIGLLDRERAFAETSNIVTRNSETAARLSAQADVGAGSSRSPGVIEQAGNLNFGTAAMRMGDKFIGGARSAAQERMNEELAGLLTSRDPQALTRAIGLIQRAQRRGDIGAERARQLVQAFSVGGAVPVTAQRSR
ncbi:MAG: hypothetical protein WC058_01095 [Phycisphaeraceae bacterium]